LHGLQTLWVEAEQRKDCRRDLRRLDGRVVDRRPDVASGDHQGDDQHEGQHGHEPDGEQEVGEARRHLRSIQLIRLDDDLLDRAAELDPPTLRALDAIHLAAALTLGKDLAAMVTYDERLAAAGRALGLPIVTPR